MTIVHKYIYDIQKENHQKQTLTSLLTLPGKVNRKVFGEVYIH